MRFMKKAISVALVAAMALSMTACGNKQANNGTEGNAGQETTATAFKIGGIGPVTGGAAVYGQAVKNAAELAVEEINAAGEIKMEFNFQDDEHDAEKSVNAYNTLKDWGMQMLLGTVTSAPCTAVVEKTNADNMFQLTPSGSAVESIQHPNAFRVCFSDPNQGAASAQYIGENKIAKKVAVIYDSSDVYSAGIYQTFATEAKNYGIEVVTAQAFTADNKTDFTVQLQKAKTSGAELVFLPIYYTEAALILTQADKMNYKPIFFGCDGLDGILAVEGFDPALAEDVMLLTPFAADAKDERTQNFVKKYKEKYNDTPSQFAADAYDGIYAIAEAVKKSGVTPDMSISDICEGMKKAMTEITIDGLTGEGMTWSADGEPNKAPKAVVIKDGSYVLN